MRICKARSANLGNGLNLVIGVTFNFYIFGSTTAAATAVTRHLSFSCCLFTTALHTVAALLFQMFGTQTLALHSDCRSKLRKLSGFGRIE